MMILMMGLLAHDAASIGLAPDLSGPLMATIFIGPYAILVVMVMWACRRAMWRLSTQPESSARWMRRLDRINTLARLLVLGLFMADLYLLGLLTWLRDGIGHWVLLPDVAALSLPLGSVIMMWWAYYPIDRRLREATLIRQFDTGEPVWTIGTRSEYVLSQIRHQLLLMLVPLLVLLGWTQIVERVTQPGMALAPYRIGLILLGGAGAFTLAPLMIRYVWDTVALPEGPLRQRLLELCRAHGVRVRQLLLWRTYGGMINGAVMGVSRHVRYILLTDGLIQRMSDRQIESVMAHELGHIVRRHMPWMIVCAMAVLWALAAAMDSATAGLQIAGILPDLDISPYWAMGTDAVATLILVGLWALAFGYISRRFERQADTFAVQHMAHDGVITNEAVEAVADALTDVALLNRMTPHQKSWRHGSIAWRINYLRTLVGRPVDQCEIDRLVARIRWACGLLLACMIAIEYLRTM
ncbi:M48 family metalloprotease [Planctomycetales bacterium ZRK34]|nr:M48 family metalloprotease [Planctomycetales bacterium ZRK34]